MELPQGRISGKALTAVVALVRDTPAKHLVAKILRSQLGISALRQLPAAQRRNFAASYRPLRARAPRTGDGQGFGVPLSDSWPRPAKVLHDAFLVGRTTPLEVAERALRGAKAWAQRGAGGGPVHVFDEVNALEAAKAATERYERGEPKSTLDGVPIVIKEEIHFAGLPTCVGTSFLKDVATSDCPAVARLRSAGATLIGQTPMTEFGLSPLGGNPHRDMPRNAHSPGHLPGGSSSGSGVAVAAGIVPVAMGLDGGGSVRIPACFNGMFGLKPTFGRIPASGHGLDGGSSMVHLGPIGASSFDLAAFTEQCTGSDADDESSTWQPELATGELVGALGRGVRGLKIGIIESEWRDANSSVAKAGRDALKQLERDGAEIVNVELPLAPHASAIGYLTIGLEILTALHEIRRDHAMDLGLDVQMLVANMSAFESDDYLDAQRLRAALREQVAEVLRNVDVIALPTTANTAPPVTDEEAQHGFVDPPALAEACRYAFVGNLTGIPCGTAPVGTDSAGLPIGLQIMGDSYDEATVLQVLAQLERAGVAAPPRPAQAIDLLG